ncbi:hypothetical protein [Streptomyces sp. SID8111]|uniref:hypothetical protein n=1 Tax=Streptomyces sp. SID8111 TaxID=2706100 RepID=UPI001944A145
MGGHTVKRTTAAVLLALATLTACSSTDSSSDSKPDKPAAVPAYKITQQDDSGTQRVVAVDVDSTKDMKTVFEDVAAKLKDDAGWFVEINCAEGGARLANGKKAVGSTGAAATGLDDGATEFEALPDAECPA